MLVYGTRPEAIKLAPLVAAMRDDERFNPIVVVTGQHREMLDQVHEFFGIVPDDDLDIHSPGQTLTQITNRCLQGVGQAIEAHRPDAVVVQGDTTSAFAAALAMMCLAPSVLPEPVSPDTMTTWWSRMARKIRLLSSIELM